MIISAVRVKSVNHGELLVPGSVLLLKLCNDQEAHAR